MAIKVWNGTQEIFFTDAPHTFNVKIYDCSQDLIPSSAPWTTIGPNYAPNFRYEEGTGPKTLQIKVPV